ncbi:MAG: hypothetical protein AAF589_07345 [Planctomycetota bacterium]
MPRRNKRSGHVSQTPIEAWLSKYTSRNPFGGRGRGDPLFPGWCAVTLVARAAVLGWLAAVLAARLLGAAPAVTESYDGAAVSWRQPARAGTTRIIHQERVRITRDGGEVGAEHVAFRCPPGYSAVFLHAIGKAPVLEEFAASVMLRSNRAGAQLAVRVVFPRSVGGEGRGSEPLQMIVRGGDRYEAPLEWQELTFSGLPERVRQQARIHATGGATQSLDERGAYVDAIVLIVPGGEEGSEFWTDHLRVDGVVVEARAASTTEPADDAANAASPSPEEITAIEPFNPTRGFENKGQRFFPIVWSHRGEPLSVLRQLGFNTVALAALPTAEQSKEATRLNLRLICPPPEPEGLTAVSTPPVLERLLAWSPSAALEPRSLDAFQPTIQRVRGHAALSRRPLLVAVQGEFALWSRAVDGLVLQEPRSGLGTMDFASAAATARPGTPWLARIHVTRSAQAAEQLQTLAPTGKASPWRPVDEIVSAVSGAIAAGAQGVWFESRTPVGNAFQQDQKVAAALELLNLELAMREPWLVSGQVRDTIATQGGAGSVAMLRRGRTKLIIAIEPRPQRVSAGQLVIPSVPETAEAFAMTPAGLTRVSRQRALGGVVVEASVVGPGASLLLTDDQQAVRDIGRRIAKSAPRAVALQQTLTAADIEAWRSAGAGVSTNSANASSAVLVAANRWLSRSKASQASGDLLAAYRACLAARELMRGARDEFRRRLAPDGRLVSSPLVTLPTTWTDELRLRELLRALPRRGNLLAGGDFEDLDQVRSAGWRHTRVDGAEVGVQLSGDEPVHGQRCLSLKSAGATPATAVAAWVVSPVTPIPAGQLIEVTGWVRFTGRNEARGGLWVLDSLGGEELAVAVEHADGWRPFRLIRRPAKRAALRVSFALVGAGEASIDAVMVRPVAIDAGKAPSGQGVETALIGGQRPIGDQRK